LTIIRFGAFALALVIGIVCPAAAKEPARAKAQIAPQPANSAETLDEVLARFDHVQGQIRTLSAEFVQTTRSPLLKDAVVSKGRFYLTKPDSVLWEYSDPELMRFVVADGKYTGYFPERKKAEKRDIKRWSEQLFRFLGVGQGSKELGKFYEISLGAAGPRKRGVSPGAFSQEASRAEERG
jgi:hypothetical protein